MLNTLATHKQTLNIPLPIGKPQRTPVLRLRKIPEEFGMGDDPLLLDGISGSAPLPAHKVVVPGTDVRSSMLLNHQSCQNLMEGDDRLANA